SGRFDPAHELDDDIGVGDGRLGVGGQQFRVDSRAGTRCVPHDDGVELQWRPDAFGQAVCAILNPCGDLRADDSASEHGNLQCLHILTFSAVVLDAHLLPGPPSAIPGSVANICEWSSGRTIHSTLSASTASTPGRGMWL